MIEIKNKSRCTSCTACKTICPKQCITMKKDEEGFLYPVINESNCIDCHLCEKVCPLLNEEVFDDTITEGYAVINKNEQVRNESTSGGFFSLLANYVLDLNGYVVGACYDENFIVKHIAINDKNELYKLRGAKYSQSELGNIFKQVRNLLDQKKYVLFSGTPCQVSGLKSFLRKDYERLITVDLICHGVPSPLAWKKYLEYRYKQDNNGEKAISINLRSKISGWSNYHYSVVFDYDNYKYEKLNGQDPFMKSFVSNLCLRPSCYSCHFKGIQRISDFTLGDYWGIWNQIPEMDDSKGTSIVFVHSQLGKNIFNQLKNSILYQEVDVNKAIEENPSMIKNSQKNDRRKDFMNDLKNHDFNYLIDKYELKQKIVKPTLLRRILNKVKR